MQGVYVKIYGNRKPCLLFYSVGQNFVNRLKTCLVHSYCLGIDLPWNNDIRIKLDKEKNGKLVGKVKLGNFLILMIFTDFSNHLVTSPHLHCIIYNLDSSMSCCVIALFSVHWYKIKKKLYIDICVIVRKV